MLLLLLLCLPLAPAAPAPAPAATAANPLLLLHPLLVLPVRSSSGTCVSTTTSTIVLVRRRPQDGVYSYCYYYDDDNHTVLLVLFCKVQDYVYNRKGLSSAQSRKSSQDLQRNFASSLLASGLQNWKASGRVGCGKMIPGRLRRASARKPGVCESLEPRIEHRALSAVALLVLPRTAQSTEEARLLCLVVLQLSASFGISRATTPAGPCILTRSIRLSSTSGARGFQVLGSQPRFPTH